MTAQRRPAWEIADVLARTDLVSLLDEVAQPANHGPRGRRWHCPVPDHDDHHASVTVHTDHRGHERWRCWSGDDTHRGDAIDLVMVTQRRGRVEAMDWLAQRAGMIPDQPMPPVRRTPTPAARTVPLEPCVVRYAQACERILWGHGGREVRDWLHRRGFDDALLRANHVGADPGRRMLPRRRGLPHGATAAAVFPALDPAGAIHYLQARYLQPEAGVKYDNPASSLGSNPRLAWTQTRDRSTRAGLLVVCEGVPDALVAAGAGYAAVGVLGSQAPDERVAARLAGHATSQQQRLFAVVDADPAGRAWGERLGSLLGARDVELTVIEPRDGGDLNEWAQRDPNWWRCETLQASAPSAQPLRRPTGLTVAG